MSTSLVNSTPAQLTVNQLPTDNTKVLVTAPKELAISDRLLEIIDQYRPNIIQQASVDAAPNAVTALIPRDMVTEVISLLQSFTTVYYPETANMTTLLTGVLTLSSGTPVEFTRGYWKQLSRVFEELKVRECDINKLSAAVRAMSMPLSTDVATVASEQLLDAALVMNAAAPESWLDTNFQTEYTDVIDPPVPIDDAVADVLSDNAATIGNPPNESATNVVEFDPSKDADNIPVVDADKDGEILKDTVDGVLDLFSSNTLNTPLNKIKELGIRNDSDGNKVITHWGFTEVTLTGISEDAADDTEIATLADLRAVSTTATYRLYHEAKDEVISSDVDLNKSLLDQDWAVAIPQSSTTLLSTTTNLSVSSKTYNITDPALLELCNDSMLRSTSTKLFRGVISNKTYTAVQVRSISSSLGAIWGKLKNLKLPTPAHISNATNLLATGLGAIGQITGSSGLQTASNVLSTINSGLGSLLSTPEPSDGITVPTVDDSAKLYRHALNIIPSLARAGKARLERDSNSSQEARITLYGQARKVNTAYGSLSSSTSTTTLFSTSGSSIDKTAHLAAVKASIKRKVKSRRA